MKETFIPLLVLLIVYLVLSLNYKKENFEAAQKWQKRRQSIHTSEVLSPEVNPQIYKVARSLIKKVNQDLKVNYQMGKFDNVIEDSDNEGNPRYVLDFFVYSINHKQVNDLNRRLIADVTVYPKNNQLQINTLNFSNAIKDQGPQHLSPSDDVVDGNLILKPSLTGQDSNPSAGPHLKSWRGTLEYGKFAAPIELDNSDPTNFQSWILPHQMQEKKDLRAFPCRDYGDWWDTDSIPLTKIEENGVRKLGGECAKNFDSDLAGAKDTQPGKESEWCYGSYNTATDPRHVTGQFYPSQLGNPSTRPKQKYNWLFTAERGITGNAHGSSAQTGY